MQPGFASSMIQTHVGTAKKWGGIGMLVGAIPTALLHSGSTAIPLTAIGLGLVNNGLDQQAFHRWDIGYGVLLEERIRLLVLQRAIARGFRTTAQLRRFVNGAQPERIPFILPHRHIQKQRREEFDNEWESLLRQNPNLTGIYRQQQRRYETSDTKRARAPYVDLAQRMRLWAGRGGVAAALAKLPALGVFAIPLVAIGAQQASKAHDAIGDATDDHWYATAHARMQTLKHAHAHGVQLEPYPLLRAIAAGDLDPGDWHV